jgi:alpha-1,3-rhamnosyltransferase
MSQDTFAVEDGFPMDQNNAPLVTAVVPVYNHEKFVIESIRSILHQTYRNIELIVINDGSKDHSHEMVSTLIEECKRRFVRFEYINRENIGLSATLNQALSMTKGKYFSAMASDDIASPEKIELLVNALEEKGSTYAAAFGNALFIDNNGQQISLDEAGRVTQAETSKTFSDYLEFRTLRGKHLDYRGSEFGSFVTLLSHNYLPAMSNLIRTDLIKQANGWTNGNTSEDWEMWRKLSKEFKFVYVDKPLAFYRWHDSNSVKTISDKLKLCSLLLLKNEKQYCVRNALIPLWRKAYASLLVPVLLDKRIALTEKLSVLNLSDMPYVLLYLARRLAYKSLRMIINRETV